MFSAGGFRQFRDKGDGKTRGDTKVHEAGNERLGEERKSSASFGAAERKIANILRHGRRRDGDEFRLAVRVFSRQLLLLSVCPGSSRNSPEERKKTVPIIPRTAFYRNLPLEYVPGNSKYPTMNFPSYNERLLNIRLIRGVISPFANIKRGRFNTADIKSLVLTEHMEKRGRTLISVTKGGITRSVKYNATFVVK